jgi:hypothetical protein
LSKSEVKRVSVEHEQKGATAVTDDPVHPRFFSLRFHTVFFPSVLRDRVFRKKRQNEGATFTSTLEMMVCLAVCLILAIIGIPSAWTEKSVIGWVMTIIGLGGIVALLGASVGAQWGERPRYESFLAWVFFFFLALGLFVGIPVGMESHSAWLGVATSVGGLILGYIVGVLAGLRLQHLGWVATILNLIAAFGTVVIVGTAVIMAVILITSR